MAADRHNNTESDGRGGNGGGIPHRGSPSPYNQHRVIKIANLYSHRSTEFRISEKVTISVCSSSTMRKYHPHRFESKGQDILDVPIRLERLLIAMLRG